MTTALPANCLGVLLGELPRRTYAPVPTGFRANATVILNDVLDLDEVDLWLLTTPRGRYAYTPHYVVATEGRGFATRLVRRTKIEAQFEDTRDAVLFKLTWGGAL